MALKVREINDNIKLVEFYGTHEQLKTGNVNNEEQGAIHYVANKETLELLKGLDPTGPEFFAIHQLETNGFELREDHKSPANMIPYPVLIAFRAGMSLEEKANEVNTFAEEHEAYVLDMKRKFESENK